MELFLWNTMRALCLVSGEPDEAVMLTTTAPSSVQEKALAPTFIKQYFLKLNPVRPERRTLGDSGSLRDHTHTLVPPHDGFGGFDGLNTGFGLSWTPPILFSLKMQ
ncbi:hypothetical protein NQZ68_004282 [Dissostichus eleginoides]|nr:hypothetical protein NQZ68_004282 [Dissostichus eleginoides]